MKRIHFLSLMILLSGCGQGVDPFEALGDPELTPEFIAPIDSSVYITPFSAAAPQLGINMGGFSNGYRVKAPSRGLIVALDGSGTSLTVTAYFNSHYTWVVTNLNTVALRVGDVVKAGQDIASANELMTFKVVKDGLPVCPYPLMEATGKAYVQLTLATPCT